MINKNNGYRPSLKMYEEVGISEENRIAFNKIKEELSKVSTDMFMTQLIYGTSGCEIKEDDSIRSLSINELMNIKIERDERRD